MTATILDSGELVRFLLARLDDDRSELGALRRTAGPVADGPHRDGVQSVDRRRVELVAKRRMIASLQQLITLRDLPAEKFVRDEAMTILRALALPYAEHRSYRSHWHISTR